MEKINLPFYVFNSHLEAEHALQSLHNFGFDMRKLSLVSKAYHSEGHPMGFYAMGDRIKPWGGVDAFWNGVWGSLFTPTIFFLPEMGLMALTGPVVAALVGVLERTPAATAESPLGLALAHIGVPSDQVIKYQIAARVDKYVLMVHGNAQEVVQARSVLAIAKTWQAA